jgi:hypothetical protein
VITAKASERTIRRYSMFIGGEWVDTDERCREGDEMIAFGCIVVAAGSAGAVVCGRLSEDPPPGGCSSRRVARAGI